MPERADIAAFMPAAPLWQEGSLPPQGPDTLDRIDLAEALARTFPQQDLPLRHSLWAGLYARTLFVPRGVMITGVQIRIPTLLVVSGDLVTLGDDGFARLQGFHVLRGRAGRKALFVALEDSHMTMLFATGARTVEEAEREFTDTPEKLRR